MPTCSPSMTITVFALATKRPGRPFSTSANGRGSPMSSCGRTSIDSAVSAVQGSRASRSTASAAESGPSSGTAAISKYCPSSSSFSSAAPGNAKPWNSVGTVANWSASLSSALAIAAWSSFSLKSISGAPVEAEAFRWQ